MEWRKITQENAATVRILCDRKYPVIIARKNIGSEPRYKYATDWQASLESMVKHGGYYYTVLAKLY